MRIVMMGTGAFAEPTFQALLNSKHEIVGLVTNPDRPSGRERELIRGMKHIALEHQLHVFQPESANTPEGVAGITAFQPELLVVAAYGQILSKEVLAIAPKGGINVHASLLPKYRGAAPIDWAIYHGETRTGVTIIRMSVQLDAGEMLAQEAIDILTEETTGELEARLAPLGANLAMRVIGELEAGTAKGVKQDPALVTKAPKLKKEHGLIDWNRSAEQVRNQIRAMQPWPTAYTYWHREGYPPLRLIITKVETVDAPANAAPGTIFRVEKDALFVAAGSGQVSVKLLQPSGKKQMAVGDFLHGHRLGMGERLGAEV